MVYLSCGEHSLQKNRHAFAASSVTTATTVNLNVFSVLLVLPGTTCVQHMSYSGSIDICVLIHLHSKEQKP